jgi:uncharacterized protein (TIGR00106 family)
MSVTALLSVTPVVEGSMAEEVAAAVAALDEFDVDYETTAMGTVVQADSADELFAAAAAAHDAVDSDRVSTLLKVDDRRTTDEDASAKVDRVEAALGRPARRER